MRKLFGLIIGFALGAFATLAVRESRADYVNVDLGSHAESYQQISTFTNANSVANSVDIFTTAQTHRSFAVQNTCTQAMALVMVRPGQTLSSASKAPIYVPANYIRVVDNGSDQALLLSGTDVRAYAPGTVPTGCTLTLDQMF